MALTKILAGVGPLESALDLPCGTGRLSPVFTKVAKRVILADSSQVMLEVAREDHPNLTVTFLLTSAERIDLRDGTVDMAFSHRLLHHIHERTMRIRIMSELARVSRRYVILSYYPSGFRTRIRWWLRRALGIKQQKKSPVSLHTFFEETSSIGLRLVGSTTIRRIPKAIFCLFERPG